jgi:hypothetical protein
MPQGSSNARVVTRLAAPWELQLPGRSIPSRTEGGEDPPCRRGRQVPSGETSWRASYFTAPATAAVRVESMRLIESEMSSPDTNAISAAKSCCPCLR